MLSVNKSKILGLFFTNSDGSYYTGEIGRAIGKKPGVIQRTLESMVTEGVLRSEYRGNARYFSLDKSYQFYDELKSIISKTSGAAGAAGAALEKIDGIEYAFIYGSYASGREHELSDLDVFILGRPDEGQVIKAVEGMEASLKREVNYKLMPSAAFVLHIREKDPFISAVYKEKKIMVRGDEDGLRKVIEGKPDKKAGA